MAPTTSDQWAAWVEGLPEQELWDKTVAANTMVFVRRLQQEGQTLPEVEGILRLLVGRLLHAELRIPDGGAFDLHEMTIGGL